MAPVTRAALQHLKPPLGLVLSRATFRTFLDKILRPGILGSFKGNPLLQPVLGNEMIQPPASVICIVTVHISVPDELPAPLSAELHYDMSDPYAVRLSLGAPAARPVQWVFARSLLMEGLRRPTGTGDVLVIPQHRCHPNSVRIILRSAAGAALIDIAESAVAAFAKRTVSLVPPGTESLHLDIDRALAELTGRRD